MIEYLLSKRKIIITILILFIIFLAVLFFLFFLKPRKMPKLPVISNIHPTKTISSPTPSLINKQEVKKISDKNTKDLHWLNNKDLTYLFYDTNMKRWILAKTDGGSESILLNNDKLKMSELYWSSKNDLLIYDYGQPYKTYLFSGLKTLNDLNIQGYAFSWSPSGDNLFFMQEIDNGLLRPSFYEFKSSIVFPLNTIFPEINFSSWSTQNFLLLWGYNLDTGTGKLYIYNLASSLIKLATNSEVSLPMFSPQGDKITYISDQGLYINKLGGKANLIYKKGYLNNLLNYTWVNNEEIIIYDGDTISKFWKINTNTGERQQILSGLPIQPSQYLSLATSPDGHSLAISTAKDGLWLITNLSKIK